MSILDNFIKIVDEIYGVYLDSTAGFDTVRESCIKLQKNLAVECSLSEEEIDKRSFTFGKGNPNKKGAYPLHVCSQGIFKKRNKKNGRNYRIIARLCLVMIYQYWEDYYRPRIAEENKVLKENIKWDIIGDLRFFRESIIHHKGIAIPKIENCKILKWFKEGEIININNRQFEEIIRSIKTSKYEIC
ncbi:MAG: hypothetical protein WBC21_01150 [Minisyncoccales bacterium]